jgi:hypothetical protein
MSEKMETSPVASVVGSASEAIETSMQITIETMRKMSTELSRLRLDVRPTKSGSKQGDEETGSAEGEGDTGEGNKVGGLDVEPEVA